MSKTTIKKPSGNASTEKIVGLAAKKLEASVAAMLQAKEEIAKLSTTAEESTIKLANLEMEIAALEQQLDAAKEANKVAIALEYKADERAAVERYLKANDFAIIEEAELNKMRMAINSFKTDTAKAVEDAIRTTTASLIEKHESEKSRIESQHKAETAKLQAENEMAQREVDFLKEQVESWKEALSAERTASVERSKAAAVGTINVQGPKS